MAKSEQPNDNKTALRDSLRKKMQSGAEGENQGAAPAEDAGPPPAAGANLGAGPSGDAVSVKKLLGGSFSLTGPGMAQMSVFCRQLATLVEVGIPLVQCLQTLSRRLEHPTLKRTVGDVARRVEEGDSFSEALAQHPKVFSPLMINVVRTGEEGGILEASLRYLAEIMEKRWELRRRVTGALAYPTAVLIVCGIVLLIIFGFCMPVFREIYGDVELPAITQVVLAISDFVRVAWWIILIAIVAGIFFFRRSLRTSAGLRRQWHGFLLRRMPLVRGIAVKVNVARSARTVSNLLKAGIPLIEALVIASETSENMIVSDMFERAAATVEGGGTLEEPLREANVFPALVTDMIAIGDEAGRLDMMFEKIADTYETDVHHSLTTLNTLLEPLMIVLMGIIVIVIGLAVLLPYWRIAQTIEDV